MTSPAPPYLAPSPAATRPRSPDVHLLRTGHGGHAFIVDGSCLFDLDESAFARLSAALDGQDLGAVLDDLGLRSAAPRIDDAAPVGMPVRALSLAIAQKCNLGCTYCYAREGSFGAAPKNMPLETALASVDLLLAETSPKERINLAFLGGEPLVNRTVLRRTAKYARDRASGRGQAIGFSITTNGTLLMPEDADFFEEFGFAVTVSLDGPRTAHDRQRPFKGGRGSFDAIIHRLGPLLARRGAMQVTARVTVTPCNPDLRETLDELLGLGFFSVGFSPMLASPTGSGEMDDGSLETMLDRMIACGEEFERRVLRGRILCLRQSDDCASRDPYGDAPSISLRRRSRLPRCLGRRRLGRMPPVRGRSGGRDGKPGPRGRSRPPGRMAEVAARPRSGTLPVMLGALSLWRGLSS